MSEPGTGSAAATRITPSSPVIVSTDVIRRISELENGAPVVRYRITRNRNGEVLNPMSGTVRTRADAVNYLRARDYDPSRFTIDPVLGDLTAEDQEELLQLRKLDTAGRTAFRLYAWTTNGVLLRNDEYFTEEWGKKEAVTKLGVSADALSAWPLNSVNWGDATQNWLDSEYIQVPFGDDTTFWGRSD